MYRLLSLSLPWILRESHLVSDNLVQGFVEQVIKTRMVAERLLDFRRPNFSLPFVRVPSAMASPSIADVFLQPPMMHYHDNTTLLQDCIRMGAAGVIAIRFVMIGGGRVVQGI